MAEWVVDDAAFLPNPREPVDEPNHIGLVFEHFPKCGGSEAQLLLKNSVSHRDYDLMGVCAYLHPYRSHGRSEDDAPWCLGWCGLKTPPCNRHPRLNNISRPNQRIFRIGSTRNPWRYYVSTWAWSSTHGYDEEVGQYKAQEVVAGASKADVARFRQLVAHQLGGGAVVGMFSARFYQFYLQPGHGSEGLKPLHPWPCCNEGGEAAAWVADHQQEFASAARELSSFSTYEAAHLGATDGHVSCWVHAENVVNDLRYCLQLYEAISKKSVVNWAAFEEHARQAPSNVSPHAACEDLFDEATSAMVERADAALIRDFGYTFCGARAQEQPGARKLALLEKLQNTTLGGLPSAPVSGLNYLMFPPPPSSPGTPPFLSDAAYLFLLSVAVTAAAALCPTCWRRAKRFLVVSSMSGSDTIALARDVGKEALQCESEDALMIG